MDDRLEWTEQGTLLEGAAADRTCSEAAEKYLNAFLASLGTPWPARWR